MRCFCLQVKPTVDTTVVLQREYGISYTGNLRRANAVSVLASPTESLGIDQSIGRATQSVAAI
jgi:hypothetical protein